MSPQIAADDPRFQNRVVLNRIPATDGWTLLQLACGHEIHVITAIGEGAPAPCPECLNSILREARFTKVQRRGSL